MTQVNFYSLKSADSHSRLVFACRLAEKARSLGHDVYIQTESEQQTQTMDDLLWQFNPASFLPHSLAASASDEEQEKITVGAESFASKHCDVVINLDKEPCSKPQQYTKINEIIIQDEAVLQQGRARFRFYQQQGYKPETFKL